MVYGGTDRTIYLYVSVYVSAYVIGLFLLAGLRVASGATVVVSPGDTIECAGFASTPLPVALPIINAFCMADSRCSELYGQSLGVNQPMFDHLFQTTNEVPGSVILERPFLFNVCNRTVEAANREMWQTQLRADMGDSEIACGLDQHHIFDIDTGEIRCSSFPGREIRDPNSTDGVVLTLMILLLISVLVKVGFDAWDSSVRWYALRLKIRVFNQKRGDGAPVKGRRG